MQTVKKLPLWFFVGLLTAFYFLFFCRYTLFTASDLGRHSTNGQVILETGKIFSTNLYSYTYPDRYAPNHHWLFGVIIFVLERSVGFAGITLLVASLYASVAGLVFWYIGKKYGRAALLVAGVLILPLLTDRTEIRPEVFSLFFFALEVILLLLWNDKKISSYLLGSILFIVAILWVNIHIFFFASFIVLGSFGLQAMLEKNWQKVISLCIFGVVTILGTLCNPLFIEGALYPTKILQEYGYPIAENQTPYFFLKHFTGAFHWYLVGSFVVSLIAAIFIFRKYRFKYTAELTLFIIFFAFTNKLIRFSNFFSITMALVIAIVVYTTLPQFYKWSKKIIQNSMLTSVVSLIGFILVTSILGSGLFMPFISGFGLGLAPGIQNSGEFFKQLQITGPIFNNFDIGGYLIYYLYPQQQVYLDNRAEAYPASFLEEYKAAQLDTNLWQKLDDQYNFGAIYFSRLERTEWGQNFLLETVKNKKWAPIYVDDYTIIFVKDIPAHQEIIKKYRLPDEIFKIRPA